MNRLAVTAALSHSGLALQKYLTLYQYFKALVVVVTRFLILIHAA